MCVLCYELLPDGHWSEGPEPADAATVPPLRARLRRTRILSAVLGPYGLTVSYPGVGSLCTVADRKGAGEVASGLPAVWQAADRLSPRPVDVLDTALLVALEQQNAS